MSLRNRDKYPNLYDSEGHCIFKCQGEFATEEEEFQGVYYQQALEKSEGSEHAKRKPCCIVCAKFRVCPIACDVVKHLRILGFGR
jgi:hypothetical protein